MEDGPNNTIGEQQQLSNGIVSPTMNSPQSTTQTNGVNNGDEDYSSESDALVIDETTTNKSPGNSEIVVNPFFNESLYELSQQHQEDKLINNFVGSGGGGGGVGVGVGGGVANNNNNNKKKKAPKLREYAQYLGLQPTVQFKCSRCGRAGFESFSTLNQHIINCDAEPAIQPPTQDNSLSSFKLTRKVFLCSACGTYYENWNLYLHMLEVHRRYLCLYCLGMFSVLDDLCLHIQSRHNLEPGYKNTLDDFFSVYNEPCYIVCCECNKLFSEQDNFFYHTCVSAKKSQNNSNKIKNKNKQILQPGDHITADSVTTTTTTAKTTTTITKINNSPDFRGFSPVKQPPEFLDFCRKTLNFELQLNHNSNIDDNNLETSVNDNSKEIIEREDEEEEYEEEEEEEEEDEEEEEEEERSQQQQQQVNDEEMMEKPIETRKVPKLSLKLKPGSFPEIEPIHETNSENEGNLTIDSDNEQQESNNEIESDINDNINNDEQENFVNKNVSLEKNLDDKTNELQIQIAGPDVPIIELNELEQPLDKINIKTLLQKCLKATASICIYCNHARKISVNGKQLGIHAIAEHRFSAVVSSITAEELIPESFITFIKNNLNQLDNQFFSSESSDEAITFSHTFECFQCRYSTSIHKELYLHNRKLHAKNLLLCIMCKSNFYNYSELICHLCPGIYILNYDVKFRCCMCVSDDLPSAFRLMVHLRKRHHICDVCLEMCNNQYKLSNHVWKHKLHHFCYRCCIAYRNKPDITRHLFWKHGTESVLCKKCLQKKWPHVYHFCVPPNHFQCDECNLTFTKAVSLKVHKRIHSNIKPHKCTFNDCNECFISKKLLAKHEFKHREPPEEEIKPVKIEESPPLPAPSPPPPPPPTSSVIEEKSNEPPPKPKPKIDVYDLPELNLSESDSSSESDDENKKPIEEKKIFEQHEETPITNIDDSGGEKVILENIWDDFKNYQATKEKFDNLLNEKSDETETQPAPPIEEELTEEIALMDHDYCVNPNKKDITFTEVEPDLSQSIDHDYCTPKVEIEPPKPVEKVEVQVPEKTNKNSSSSSSSDSDSSCSCGSNCSCSSSSGSSSSSSDSSDSDSSTEQGRKQQQIRREKRRQKKLTKDGEVGTKSGTTTSATPANTSASVKPTDVADDPNTINEQTIEESDLETTESDTDEEFYDKQPQKLAKKILEEKRNQLLAGIDPIVNGCNSRPITPNIPENEQPVKIKKKSKSKKKKKKKKLEKMETQPPIIPQYYNYYQTSTPMNPPSLQQTEIDNDTSLRASKRRRVPNKFYGYSSEEDDEKPQLKWKKTDIISTIPQQQQQQQPPMVPPLTIKTTIPISQPKIQPFSIRTTSGQIKIHNTPRVPPTKIKTPKIEEVESGGESNDSSNEGRNMMNVNPDALYCYCKCPYDEVSEMIGCDSRDCQIEWFHFECVGIMVPPKGHWYCPECRKKRQQKRDNMLKMKGNT